MNENKNLILAIALSVVILLGHTLFIEFVAPPPEPRQQQTAREPTGDGYVASPDPGEMTTPQAPGQVMSAAGDASGSGARRPGARPSLETVIAENTRVPIETSALQGSLRIEGARIDDLVLKKYRETLAKDSPLVRLLRPAGAPDSYYVHFGWVAQDPTVVLPGANTVWAVMSNGSLTPENPVVLTWENGQGLRFTRTVAIDDNYMFSVTQEVENAGDKTVTLFPYGTISRSGTPQTQGFFILHEGLLGVFDLVLYELDYDKLQEDVRWEKQTTGGWMGITDKYWLVSLVPDQQALVNGQMRHFTDDGRNRYQVDYIHQAGIGIAPGASTRSENRFFAGSKEDRILASYDDIVRTEPSLLGAWWQDGGMDLAIDWGWFWFLTRPIFWFLHAMHEILGNYGVAILLVTVAIKLAFFPLANKSYKSMSQMKKLQPEMVKIRERFPDDKQKMNLEMMALYKKHKVNPASGCLPILLQIPVFFALYKVLFVTIEMRHAPFYGWIQDLSVRDPTNLFTLFGLVNWPAPDFLHIGVWPILMGLTMYLQQKLNPAPADPVQAKIFMFLPLIFTVILAPFPAGLVIYWTWNNLLSILQQYVIMRRMGVAIGGGSAAATAVPAAAGGDEKKRKSGRE